MASLFRNEGGFSIDFTNTRGKRQRIRLGNVTGQQAEAFKANLESLVLADELGQPPPADIQRWLVQMDGRLHNALVTAGLTTLRLSTLGELLNAWRSSLEPKTANGSPVRAVVENLIQHFGAHTRLRAFDERSMREFQNWLETTANNGKPYSPATVSRRMRSAKQVFGFALEQRCVAQNPFRNVRGGNEVNKDKDFFVSEQITSDILLACQDAEFHALLCLVRYGAVRHPSEVTPMRWDQVLWDKEQLVVLSPKTARHPGGDRREVPLFPKLRSALGDLWLTCDTGVELVFPNYQDKGENTKQLKYVCKRAGVELWQRPWKNMRATCITEWLRTYGNGSGFSIVDVAAWAGHTVQTMVNHYAQVRGEEGSAAAVRTAEHDSSASR